MKSLFTTVIVLLSAASMAVGQNIQSESVVQEGSASNALIDYRLQAFFSIGGSSPLPIPKEIKEIESYNPSLQLGLEANATKWFDVEKKWGLRVGISAEGKGMKTKAKVKNYLTEIIQNEAKMRGYFTGMVTTNVKNAYLTIPVSAVYNVSSRWNLSAGLYASYLMDGQFDGYVSDGYFRQGSPTGSKIVFGKDSKAAYDFSKNENKFQWGAQIGAEWNIINHFEVIGNLSYGANNLFEKEFKSISFDMHNIYLDLGFSYRFY